MRLASRMPASRAFPARHPSCSDWNKTLRPPFWTAERVPCTKCNTSRPIEDCSGCARPFGSGAACCPHHKTQLRCYDRRAKKFAADSQGQFLSRRGQVRAFGFLFDAKGVLHCHLLSGGHRRVKPLIYRVWKKLVIALFSGLSGGLHAPIR